MLERGYFDQLQVTTDLFPSQEQFITTDQLFLLLSGHAQLPIEGTLSPQALREQFNQTFIGDVLLDLPMQFEVQELEERLESFFLYNDDYYVVKHGQVCQHKLQETGLPLSQYWTDGEYRLDWQTYDTAIRLAARQFIAGTNPENLDHLEVQYHPRMRYPNQFVLIQDRLERMETGQFTDAVVVEHSQYRVFELQAGARWNTRAVLSMMTAMEFIEDRPDRDNPLPELQNVAFDKIEGSRYKGMLRPTPYTPAFFDLDYPEYETVRYSIDIHASLPPHLALPTAFYLLHPSSPRQRDNNDPGPEIIRD